MQRDSTRGGAPRLVLGLLFGLSFFSNAYFLANLGSPNSISRAALTVALIEQAKTSIDPLADLTHDKAVKDGHYYSDKAPGLSFLAVPAAAVFIAIVNPDHDDRLWHGDGKISDTFGALIGVSTLLTSSLLTAISVALMCSILVERGASGGCAAAIALIYGQATPIWLWGSAFFGHSVAAALLVMGLHALLRMVAEGDARSGRWALWSGFSLGWATVVEFTAVVPAAMLVSFALLHARRKDPLQCFGLIALGALPALGLLLAYDSAAFGAPFQIGYAYVDGYEGMRTGFYGFSAPSLATLLEITLGDRNGILWLSPVLVLFPLGIAAAALSPRWRGLGALSALAVGYYVLLNSAYAYWDGGYSTGPRHLTASLPFACLLLAPLWERGGRIARHAILGLGAVSGVLCLMAVSVNIAMPDDLDLSIAGFLLPRFWEGRFDDGAASLLRQLGWPGISPVLPFLLVWIPIAGALVRAVSARFPEIAAQLFPTSPA